MKERVVLSYSGGLDTSVAIRWLYEKYNLEVITVTVDVGQGEDFKLVEENAKKIGSIRHYFIDAKMEFTEHYIHPAIKANALYEDKYPLSTALSRPLIASKLVEIAEKESAENIAHGCSGKGNDQVRFEITIKALAPHVKIIAPIREWHLTREEEIEYAEKNDIPIPVDINKPYSIDQSLWGRSIECGILEDAFQEPPESIYEWTRSPERAPNRPEKLSIKFSNGIPTVLNGVKYNPIELISILNRKAGGHGIGRIDHIEDRMVGIKSREIYECPAAVTLLEAHKDLEKTVLTRHEYSFKELADREWAFLIYSGLWVDPLRAELEAFIDKVEERITGEVKIKLYKGAATIIGRKSSKSLYNRKLAAYDIKSTFDQRLSKGFIELWGLPSIYAKRLQEKKQKP